MKSKLIVLVLALLMVGCFATTAFAIVKVSDKDDKTTHGHRHDKGDKHEKGRGHGKGHQDEGLGPYSGSMKHRWKDYWRDLTPAQRAEKMAELAQQHADGMKAWAACVQKAGDDKAARAKCERPLPPGLAKKRLGR